MPADAVLAAIHYRVELAGAALEQAASMLEIRRVLNGIVHVRQAVMHLQAAARVAEAAGSYPGLQKYLLECAAFYQSAQRVVRPADAPALAARVRGNAGYLLEADPVLSPGSAK